MRERRIVRRTAAPLPPDLAPDLHPLLARLYAARGIRHAGELDYSLARLPPFTTLRGIGEAVALLEEALQQDSPILVVGDFDADGATSVAVAVRALRSLGAGRVDFLVPNRFEYGYGLTPQIVAVARQREPSLLVTVDNGISSLEGVAAARKAGMRVLITDHHLPGERLPAADAIVNPNLPGDTFPSKSLAGVGVIFYLMLALRAHLREQGWFDGGRGEPNFAHLLDLVAVGTVADVVPLDHVNRTLVSNGLDRLRSGRGCAGLQALIRVAGRGAERLVAADLGFAVAPRLNAAGRLDDMSVGVRCLLADDFGEALALASELDRLNRERREIEGEMQASALMQLDSILPEGGQPPHALCLYDSTWHEGVIGLLASRIKERLHRPVVVLTDCGNGEVKGSARSIPGFHIRDALEAVATRHPDLIARFGGHAMAAGLTLRAPGVEPFRQAFVAEAERRLSAEELEGALLSDGELAGADLALAQMLRAAGPWGQGFPEPLFDGVFEVLEWRVLKERHLKLEVRWPGTGERVSALLFHAALERWAGDARWVELAYRLDVNEFRGERSVNLIVEQWRALESFACVRG